MEVFSMTRNLNPIFWINIFDAIAVVPYWSKKSLLWTDMTIWFVTCFCKLYFSDSKSVFLRSCEQYFSDLRITLWTRMTIWSGEEGGLWGSHGFTTSRMRPCETGGTLSAENKIQIHTNTNTNTETNTNTPSPAGWDHVKPVGHWARNCKNIIIQIQKLSKYKIQIKKLTKYKRNTIQIQIPKPGHISC